MTEASRDRLVLAQHQRRILRIKREATRIVERAQWLHQSVIDIDPADLREPIDLMDYARDIENDARKVRELTSEVRTIRDVLVYLDGAS